MVYTVKLTHGEMHAVSEACEKLIARFDRAREAAGLTKAELARRAHYQPEAVRKILTNERANPTMTTLVRLADALGMELTLVPKGQAVRPDK